MIRRLDCVGVYGASGFGRELMPLVRAVSAAGVEPCFIDDAAPSGPAAARAAILSFDDFMALPGERKGVVLGIADGMIRRRLAQRCAAAGITMFPEIRGAHTVVLDGVEIGEGAVLCGFTHLTSDIRIGRHFHANIYSYVAHDCVIGDFVTFAPGVCCNGNVHIEDDAYVGTGAIIRQGTPDAPLVIGRSAIIGMGAVVTKSVPAGATVVGNPARLLERRG